MYTSIHIRCNEDQAELISSVFLEENFNGTSFENGELSAFCDMPDPNIDFIQPILASMNLSVDRIETFEDQNWNELWESNFHDLTVEDKIHVRAPFHDFKGMEYEIIIHPKMAFGTGHHGTTQLMLKAMLGTNFNGKRVLDMGCGSGILAILASQRGADQVLAIDYDPNSTTNSEENIQLNGVENVDIMLADNLDGVNTSFDIILSNIVKNVNLSLVPSYKEKLVPGGICILCGLLIPDREEVLEFCSALDLQLIGEENDGEWLQLSFKRNYV